MTRGVGASGDELELEIADKGFFDAGEEVVLLVAGSVITLVVDKVV